MKKYTDRRRGLTKKQRRRKKAETLKNKRLVKKYYWLMPRDWDGKVKKWFKDYHYVNWGWSTGWDKAFGWMYLKELGEAVEESEKKNFRILQQKEKYGRCINYVSGHSEKISEIIQKYEVISEHICYRCGKEAPMTDDGWVLPLCFKCFSKIYRGREQFTIKLHPEVMLKTDEELRELYDKVVIDEPDEHGEYHIPTTYTLHTYRDGESKDVVYDISDTVTQLRKRIEKFT